MLIVFYVAMHWDARSVDGNVGKLHSPNKYFISMSPCNGVFAPCTSMLSRFVVAMRLGVRSLHGDKASFTISSFNGVVAL